MKRVRRIGTSQQNWYALGTTKHLSAPILPAYLHIARHAVVIGRTMITSPMMFWPVMQWASLFSSEPPHSCSSVAPAEISPFKSDYNVSKRCLMIVVTE